jgi:uncharacterized protein (DUF433 family)
VPVRTIVIAWSEYRNVPRVLAAYPRLTEEDVQEALAYYEAHRQELDKRIQAQLNAP